MKVLHWCMLGATLLLLLCQVVISQLCNSLIILVDGFHSLFILTRIAFTPPLIADIVKPFSSVNSPVSPPRAAGLPADSPAKPPSGTHNATSDGSTSSSPALHCGLSYAHCRIQTLGVFISALTLAALCLSYLMEIICFIMEPHEVDQPLLLVLLTAISLLHKIVILWMNWDQERAPGTEFHPEVNHKAVSAEEGARGRAEPGPALHDMSHTSRPAVDDSLLNGALVLCNPATSSIPDTDSQTPEPEPEPEADLQAAAPQDSCQSEVVSRDLSQSEGISEGSTCMGHLGSQNTSSPSPVSNPSHHIETPAPNDRWRVGLPLFIHVAQSVCTSLLALINNLVMLLVRPHCLHNFGACNLVIYLDAGLSMLALVILIAAATPEMHRYGLVLLQATPRHICVSDLGRRIASVPGVQAVHELHVWQLTDSLIVATVHVHCHADFPAQRCADLMSGVTKVLQSVGVSCCTVQPEFVSCSGSPAGSGGDASPVVHREDPSLTPLLACSLSCGKACTASMCCSPVEVESSTQLAPPAGETKEESQTLVIENTFL